MALPDPSILYGALLAAAKGFKAKDPDFGSRLDLFTMFHNSSGGTATRSDMEELHRLLVATSRKFSGPSTDNPQIKGLLLEETRKRREEGRFRSLPTAPIKTLDL